METTCKLDPKGCWSDGKCRAKSGCENKVVTNADRIRAMSDEEIADFLDGVQEEECKALHEVRQDGTLRFESLRDGWLAWLQQPAEQALHLSDIQPPNRETAG